MGVSPKTTRYDVLQPGQRVEAPFKKGAAISGSDPMAAEKWAYVNDPILRLPPGTWHIRAASSLTEGTCGDATINLSTEVEIQVLPDL